MKLRDINSALRRLAENTVLLVVAAIASTLGYFTFLPDWIKRALSQLGLCLPDSLAKILTFCVCLIVVFTVLLVARYLTARTYRRILSIYVGNLRSGIWPDGAGDRIKEFQELRSKANESILGMGIGMTYFSRDSILLKNLLDRNLRVRLIMINPDIIDEDDQSPLEREQSISIKKNLFDKYFSRQGYSNDVKTSYKRLVDFIRKRKADKNRIGQIELRTYPYLIPMNVTIVDESDKRERGELLIEWCLPFSEMRMHNRLSQSTDSDMFKVIKHTTEELWEKSRKVVDDYRRKV